MSNWRNWYIEEEWHTDIHNELIKGYSKLADIVARCNNIKAILENTVVTSSNSYSGYGETYGGNSGYTSITLSDDFNNNVVTILETYETNMELRGDLPGYSETNSVSSDLQINTSDSGIETVTDLFSSTSKNKNAFYYRYSPEYADSRYSKLSTIKQSLSSNIDDTNTPSIRQFATHFDLFVEMLLMNSQFTDAYTSIGDVYTKGQFTVFSSDDYDKVSTDSFGIEQRAEEYNKFMNSNPLGLTSDAKKTLYKYKNSENLLGYMCSREQTNCAYASSFKTSTIELMTNKSDIVEKIRTLETDIELQIATHESEELYLDSIITELEAISFDDPSSINRALKGLNKSALECDVSMNGEQLMVLGIEESEYHKIDTVESNEVYDEIIGDYINGELSAEELFDLCVEYPFLSAYIEIYYYENLEVHKDDETMEFFELKIINDQANYTREVQGITNVDVGKSQDGNEFNYSNENDENNGKYSFTFGHVLEGEDAARDIYKQGLNDQIEANNSEIDELNKIVDLEEEAKAQMESVISALINAGIDLSMKSSVAAFLIKKGIELTYEQIKAYNDAKEEIEVLEGENKDINRRLEDGAAYSEIGQLPFSYSRTTSPVAGESRTQYYANSNTYDVHENITAIDYAVNDTPGADSQQLHGGKTRLEVENEINDRAVEADPGAIYGDYNLDGLIDDNDHVNGVNYDIGRTVIVGGGASAYNDYANKDYLNDNGELDMNRMIDNYENDSKVYNKTDKDITQNAYR